MRKVWMNGRLIPETEAKLSVYDSALMFGDMVFEMTRSFNKKQFKLREHLERLYVGIKILRIPIDITIDQMEKHQCHKYFLETTILADVTNYINLNMKMAWRF